MSIGLCILIIIIASLTTFSWLWILGRLGVHNQPEWSKQHTAALESLLSRRTVCTEQGVNLLATLVEMMDPDKDVIIEEPTGKRWLDKPDSTGLHIIRKKDGTGQPASLNVAIKSLPGNNILWVAECDRGRGLEPVPLNDDMWNDYLWLPVDLPDLTPANVTGSSYADAWGDAIDTLGVVGAGAGLGEDAERKDWRPLKRIITPKAKPANQVVASGQPQAQVQALPRAEE